MARRQRNRTCFCTKSHHVKKAKKQNLLLSDHKNEVSTKSHDAKKAKKQNLLMYKESSCQEGKKQNLLLYKESSCQEGKETEPASVQRVIMPRRQRNRTCFCTKSHDVKKAKKQNLLLSEHKNEVSTKSHDVKKAKEQNLLLSEQKNEVSTKSHHAKKAKKQNLLLYKEPSCQEGKGTESASV